MKRIGFIGLGTMGAPMAKNLLKAGYELVICDRNAQKAKDLLDLGAITVPSAANVAQACEVLITMLPADQAVKDVLVGPQGVVEGGTAGLIVIDSSTVSPKTSKEVAAELGKRQIDMLDAPVTGSEPQAIEGKLTFVVGGKKETYEACEPQGDGQSKLSHGNTRSRILYEVIE